MLRDQGRRGVGQGRRRARTLTVAFVAAALGACQREASNPPGGTPITPELTHASSSSASAPLSVSAAPIASTLASAPIASASTSAPLPPPERPFALVELAPTQGDLTPLIAEQVARAKARGLRPFVEFYADWCPPCRAVAAAMDDPRMIEAFTGTYVIKLNVDDWKDKLPGTGFVPREIPVFYAVNTVGRPTGRSLEGKAWGKSVPENMAPKLRAFLKN